jgi:enduracididine biosynthesis enzyme MppP
MPFVNLTEMEIPALQAEINLSDGHARQSLTDGQRAIVARFPELFDETHQTPFEPLERRAQGAYLASVGQHSAPIAAGRVLSAYASSIAIDVLARCLAAKLRTVALIHPTFDNIPCLLRGWGLKLVPIEEADLTAGHLDEVLAAGAECLFVTTPNNPTGWVLERDACGRIAEACAHHGLLLCFDTSFRGFDRRAQYDMYALLDDAGVEYAIIEDTGKLWPMSELKLGFLAYSARSRLGIEHVMSDILLSVSPFVLRAVELLAEDAAGGGFDELHQLIAGNRRLVASAFADGEHGRLIDGDGRVSVSRVELPDGMTGEAAWDHLRRTRSIHVLPCRPFHWDRPGEGERLVRLALGRDPGLIARALAELRAAVEELAVVASR